MSNNGPNVHLVGGDQWGEERMFREAGWNVMKNPFDADFLCWTGGADINPALYGQKCLPITHYSDRRDTFEVDFFERFKDKKKLGICRGGQLLNALSGGSMYQDVNNHQGTHPSLDVATGKVYSFSSVHHQMMIPGDNATILAVATKSTERIRDTGKTKFSKEDFWIDDIEALWYSETQSFCFQPHPEWGPPECTEYFFRKIDQLYGMKV